MPRSCRRRKRMMLKPFMTRKLPSISEPPIEPSQTLCATQQQVEHHMMQRVVSPLVRKSAQVLTTVAPTGNNSIQ